jgi:hypothetical protein
LQRLPAEPALVDPTFCRRPDGRALDERFPVVPMTMILELMAAAALEACPGRTVIGLGNVRALRWLAAVPSWSRPSATTSRPSPSRSSMPGPVFA